MRVQIDKGQVTVDLPGGQRLQFADEPANWDRSIKQVEAMAARGDNRLGSDGPDQPVDEPAQE